MKTTQQPERIILAGDMALRFGLAIGSTTRGYLASTVIDVGEQRRGVSLARAAKLARMKITRWVQSQGCDHVDLVVYEEPAMHGHSTNRLPQYAMVTTLIWAGDDLGCWETQRYWPTHVKKLATGSGAAKKPEMIAEAQRWSGAPINDDNEADAVCLLKVALHHIHNPKQEQTALSF